MHIINQGLCRLVHLIILTYDQPRLSWQITCTYMYLHEGEPNTKNAGISPDQESLRNAVNTSLSTRVIDYILPQLQPYL